MKTGRCCPCICIPIKVGTGVLTCVLLVETIFDVALFGTYVSQSSADELDSASFWPFYVLVGLSCLAIVCYLLLLAALILPHHAFILPSVFTTKLRIVVYIGFAIWICVDTFTKTYRFRDFLRKLLTKLDMQSLYDKLPIVKNCLHNNCQQKIDWAVFAIGFGWIVIMLTLLIWHSIVTFRCFNHMRQNRQEVDLYHQRLQEDAMPPARIPLHNFAVRHAREVHG